MRRAAHRPHGRRGPAPARGEHAARRGVRRTGDGGAPHRGGRAADRGRRAVLGRRARRRRPRAHARGRALPVRGPGARDLRRRPGGVVAHRPGDRPQGDRPHGGPAEQSPALPRADAADVTRTPGTPPEAEQTPTPAAPADRAPGADAPAPLQADAPETDTPKTDTPKTDTPAPVQADAPTAEGHRAPESPSAEPDLGAPHPPTDAQPTTEVPGGALDEQRVDARPLDVEPAVTPAGEGPSAGTCPASRRPSPPPSRGRAPGLTRATSRSPRPRPSRRRASSRSSSVAADPQPSERRTARTAPRSQLTHRTPRDLAPHGHAGGAPDRGRRGGRARATCTPRERLGVAGFGIRPDV